MPLGMASQTGVPPRQLSSCPPCAHATLTCDYWVDVGYTCEYAESYWSCDCGGCACAPTPSPTPLPTQSTVNCITVLMYEDGYNDGWFGYLGYSSWRISSTGGTVMDTGTLMEYNAGSDEVCGLQVGEVPR